MRGTIGRARAFPSRHDPARQQRSSSLHARSRRRMGGRTPRHPGRGPARRAPDVRGRAAGGRGGPPGPPLRGPRRAAVRPRAGSSRDRPEGELRHQRRQALQIRPARRPPAAPEPGCRRHQALPPLPGAGGGRRLAPLRGGAGRHRDPGADGPEAAAAEAARAGVRGAGGAAGRPAGADHRASELPPAPAGPGAEAAGIRALRGGAAIRRPRRARRDPAAGRAVRPGGGPGQGRGGLSPARGGPAPPPAAP